jgi:hypothetical protein
MAKKQRGRPAGSRNGKYEVGASTPSRCKSCGSTERTPYFATNETAHRGIHDGEPYTHIVWRRTKCLHCGQLRTDRALENRKRPAE